jgi:hypothetical protein
MKLSYVFQYFILCGQLLNVSTVVDEIVLWHGRACHVLQTLQFREVYSIL